MYTCFALLCTHNKIDHAHFGAMMSHRGLTRPHGRVFEMGVTLLRRYKEQEAEIAVTAVLPGALSIVPAGTTCSPGPAGSAEGTSSRELAELPGSIHGPANACHRCTEPNGNIEIGQGPAYRRPGANLDRAFLTARSAEARFRILPPLGYAGKSVMNGAPIDTSG